ncbi:helix-turn-helix transcriptional regulator [Allostreptomyces psammosilenae]|uniref:Transcriptional regulator with XRE-family HTH domain n=1 Tax=Allostreptomyces psammosilenae TaxID=1892865 RepID=A0A852ZME2_9ACTN|nr:helix-turn-helix transcriptional regulator [Allostreptomyces psammosilenae]NYI03569.1 transcriptional regulator with XRE-family HTH domain [Allostreptomyces psammosilenae]
MTSNDLGEFLRARRARLRPEEVGLPSYGQRRVAGLRREEVAVLAGMNTDYYARLEQGRERRPSPQILDAVSAALRLDDEARDHLYRLAGAVPDERRRPRPAETVSAELRELLDGYAHTPAFVLNPALDILTANDVARALYSPFERMDNLARMVFLDPAARDFHRHWERAAEAAVASLRHSSGLDPDHPRLPELVRTLTEGSAEFAALWGSHAVHAKTRDAKALLHPEVGPLDLTFQTFDVRGARGQQVVIYHAEPGSPSAQALALLGTLEATRRAEGGIRRPR